MAIFIMFSTESNHKGGRGQKTSNYYVIHGWSLIPKEYPENKRAVGMK